MANTLNSGDHLNPGQSITSSNGRYILMYQNDGNLVLYINGGSALWSSQTNGKLFAATKDNILWWRDPVANVHWQNIGEANNVVVYGCN